MISKLKDNFKNNKILTIIIILLVILLLMLLVFLVYKLSKILLVVFIFVALIAIGKGIKSEKTKSIDKKEIIANKENIKPIKIDNKKERKVKEKEEEEEKEKELEKEKKEKDKEKNEKEVLSIKLKETEKKVKELEANLYNNNGKINSFHASIKDNETIGNAKAIEEKKAYSMFSGYLRNNVNEKTIVKVNNPTKTIPILKEKIEKYGNIPKIENVSHLIVSPKLKEKIKVKEKRNSLKLPEIKQTASNNNTIDGSTFLYTLGIRKKEKKVKLTEEELITCAHIGKIITEKTNEKKIAFYKDNNGYIEISSTKLKFKIGDKKKYLIMSKNEKTELKEEECDDIENKKENKRVIFDNIDDLKKLSNYINKEYQNKQKNNNINGFFFFLKEKNIERILKKEEEKKKINSYIDLARTYKENNNNEEAQRILKEGIKELKEQNINSKRLQNELKKINKRLEIEKEKEKEKRKIKKLD